MMIGKNYKIDSDSLNVILSHKIRRKAKAGDTYIDWQIMGYYATVENALQGLVNQGVRDTELTDMKTIVAKIDELQRLIQPIAKMSQGHTGARKGQTGSYG